MTQLVRRHYLFGTLLTIQVIYLPAKSLWGINGNPQPGPNGTVVVDYYHGGGYMAIDKQGASVSLTFNGHYYSCKPSEMLTIHLGSYIVYYSDLYFSHGSMEASISPLPQRGDSLTDRE